MAVGWEDDEDPQSFIDDVEASSENVDAFNNWLATYFAERCKSASKRPPSGAELGVIAELLVAVADLHAGADANEFELPLPATPENRALIAAAIEHGAARGWQAKVKKIQAAKDELVTRDVTVLRYCADRCRGKAASPKPSEPAAAGTPTRAGIAEISDARQISEILWPDRHRGGMARSDGFSGMLCQRRPRVRPPP